MKTRRLGVLLLLLSVMVLAGSCAMAVKRGKGKKIIESQQKKHAKKYHRTHGF